MITEARQSEPTPAVRYTSGTVAPAKPAAWLVASELAITSASRANESPKVSPSPRMPRRRDPTRSSGSSNFPSLLGGNQREDTRGSPAGGADPQRRRDDHHP